MDGGNPCAIRLLIVSPSSGNHPMKPILRRTRATSLTFVFCTAAMASALAADPVCNQLIAATQMLRTKPFHLYLTETQSFANAVVSKAAGQQGPMKMLTVGRYEFSGVQAPAHAMTLKDMIHSTRGH